MQVPLEVTYRGVEKSDAIDTLIDEKVEKLEEVCDYINSCHIAIEKPHDRPSHGSPYRVRLDITVPPGHEIIAENNQSEGDQYQPLNAAVREAFDAARRQLRKLAKRQNESDKGRTTSASQETTALVVRVFRDEGYGFLKTLDGQEVYFHRNSVLLDDFDRIEVGTGVRCFVTQGDEGPQASTVKIVDKPGENTDKAAQTIIQPPLDWRE